MDRCECHACTQARWKSSFQGQFESTIQPRKEEVLGVDRVVYYRKNNDGTYTEMDGNIDLGRNSSVDESAVQSGHYPTYGGLVRERKS